MDVAVIERTNLGDQLQQRLHPIECWIDDIRHLNGELSVLLTLALFVGHLGGLRALNGVVIVVGHYGF